MCLLLLIGLFFVLLLSRSEILQAAAEDALLFSAKKLIPALFPFAVLSRFLLLSDLFPKQGKLLQGVARLFHVHAETLPAFFFGLFCGFPMGAYAAATLLESKRIPAEEAFFVASVANNISAPFLLLTASELFGSPRAGKILFFAQTTASLIVALLWASRRRKKAPIIEKPAKNPAESPRLLPLFADAVSKGGSAMLSVTAFVVFFSVIAKAITLIPPLNPVSPLLLSLLEATSAIRASAALLSLRGLPAALALAAFSAGFSGLSVFMQSEALFDGKLPLLRLFYARTAIAALSAAITFVAGTVLL